MSGVERLSQGAHACLRELLSSSGDSLSRAAPARGIWCYRVRRLTAERCLTCDKRGPTTTLVTKPRKRQGRHDLRSQRPLQLPLLGSNQDSPDPESGVLPVTPRGSALDFFFTREANTNLSGLHGDLKPRFPTASGARWNTCHTCRDRALRSTRSPAAIVLLRDNAESSSILSTAHALPNGKARGPTHRPAQSPWRATPAHRPSA